MLAKRDLQFVRLACKWRWLTAEEGEDVLFLKRKFGAKLSIEEIVRRRGYLAAGEIADLASAASNVAGRRARPIFSRDEPLPAPSKSTPVVPKSPPPTPSKRPVPKAPPGGDMTLLDYRSPLSNPGVLGLSPPPAVEAEDRRPPAPPPVSPPAERTIIAPMPDAVRAARAALMDVPPVSPPSFEMDDHHERATATDLDREELLAAALAVDDVDGFAGDADDEQERTIFDMRNPLIVAGIVEEPTPRHDPEQGAPIPLPLDALSVVETPSRDEASIRPQDPALRPPIVAGRPVQDPAEQGARSMSLLAQVADSEAGSFHDGRVSMPGEPLAGLILEGIEDDAVTADGAQIASLVADEFAAENLLGTFGAYRLERLVARGTRSVVYLGVHVESGRAVAVKVLDGEASAARLIAERGDELLTAARAESANIVRVVDVGRVEKRCYVALDYVDGWTLEEKLAASERPAPLEAISIARDVARALAAAEAIGLVHKDVRPGNVLLAPERAMLTGFGFAKTTDGMAGSTGYMAPERYNGAPTSVSTDLYSLGVVMYRMLTNEFPHDGEDARAIAASASALEPADVRTYEPGIPAPVAELVMRLLSREPAVRGASAAEVAERLDQLAFDLEAAGVLGEREDDAPPAMKPIILRAAIASAVGLALSVAIPSALTMVGVGTSSLPSVALDTALVGTLLSIIATVLLGTVALIRRGEIPLPMSSAWLVRLEEGAGALGTVFLVAGLVFAPPAILNLFVSFLAIIVLSSWAFGIVLRRAIAFKRHDGGVGRMLAVLGDPMLGRWRVVHAPLLAALTCLATVRFMLLAYFAAG